MADRVKEIQAVVDKSLEGSGLTATVATARERTPRTLAGRMLSGAAGKEMDLEAVAIEDEAVQQERERIKKAVEAGTTVEALRQHEDGGL